MAEDVRFPWANPYKGLYGEAPPERGTFFNGRLVYERGNF